MLPPGGSEDNPSGGGRISGALLGNNDNNDEVASGGGRGESVTCAQCRTDVDKTKDTYVYQGRYWHPECFV